jgi:hypothetical protein
MRESAFLGFLGVLIGDLAEGFTSMDCGEEIILEALPMKAGFNPSAITVDESFPITLNSIVQCQSRF